MIEECVHCGWNAMGQCGCPGAVKEQIRIDELESLRTQLHEMAEAVTILNSVIEKAKALNMEPKIWNALYRAIGTVELIDKAKAITAQRQKDGE